jgi:hypothetical protein
MDFEPRYTQEQEEFRQQVHRRLKTNLPPNIVHPADSAGLTLREFQTVADEVL